MIDPPDACDFLDADHVVIELLFSQYSTLSGSRTKPAIKKRVQLARDICLNLSVHARLEHEVFYPALQAALNLAEILAEAEVEHECVHFLMARIEQKVDVDTDFDALVKTLSMHVEQHVQKERNAIFPVVRDSRRLDLPLLRQTLEARRQAIALQESDKVAARLRRHADEKAVQRELTLRKNRDAAKARKSRSGAVVIHTLALRDAG